MKYVLILTRTNDRVGSQPIFEAIERKGGKPVRFDTDRFPTEIFLEMSIGQKNENLSIITPDGRYDHKKIKGVYFRRINAGGNIPKEMEIQTRNVCLRESRACVDGLIGSIDAIVVDPYWNINRAENKQLQLKVAQKLGLDIPKTLITNSPAAVKDFAKQSKNGIITKMQKYFSINDGTRENTLFTSKVKDEDLEHLEGLKLSPMTFQELIEKKREFRVIIVADKIFSFAIDAKILGEASLDWRKRGIALIDNWEPVDLPTELEAKLLELVDFFNLQYGAVDIIQTPDNRYVFLEINPCGEYYWLDNLRETRISDTLAEVLLGKRKR